MATVVREIERKYDPAADGMAALDAVKTMTATAGVAAVSELPEQLRRAGARSAAAKAKLQRALAGRLPAARPAPQQRLTRHSPAGQVVLAYLRDQVAAISHYDPLVRRDEPDAVHQMRVATRRARSALEAFGGIIDRETTRPLCAELKWLAAMLGQARDSAAPPAARPHRPRNCSSCSATTTTASSRGQCCSSSPRRPGRQERTPSPTA